MLGPYFMGKLVKCVLHVNKRTHFIDLIYYPFNFALLNDAQL